MNEAATFGQQWAILELLGHRKLGGLVQEQTVAGVAMIRIDIPDGEKFATQFYSPSALYCITPCGEEVARAYAVGHQPSPVNRWELKTLPAGEHVIGTGGIEPGNDDDDWNG